MKERLIYIGTIIVLAMLLALSLGRSPKVIETNTVTTDTVKVNIHHYDTAYIPKPVVVSTTDTVTIRQRDTVYVYNDYYKIREYRDTLRAKEGATYLYLYEKVSKNMISSRYYNFYESNLNITKTMTNTEFKEKAHLYFDITATTDLTEHANFYLGLTLKSRYKGIYSIGYDPINKSYLGKVGFKIF